MAQLSVLDERTETNPRLAEPREISAAERRHAKEIEIYRKMLYAGLSDADVAEDSAVSAPKEEAPAGTSAAQRLADYKAYAAPATKKVLFEGITYKNGELIEDAPAVTAPTAAPAADVLTMPVSAPAEEDDAVPTRRTMETLRRSAMSEKETAQETGTSVFAAVSAKTKIVLAAIACAILLAIVLICVNTGIINAIDADIEAIRARAQEQKQTYEDLVRELNDMEDIDGEWSKVVEEYAKENNMTRG